MRINLKAQHITLTSAISDYVEKRLGSLKRFVQENAEAGVEAMLDVELSMTTKHHHVSSELFTAKATFNAGTIHMRCEASDMDLYAAIDKLKDELARDITSEKKKRVTLLRRGGQRIKKMIRGLYSRDEGSVDSDDQMGE